MCQLFIILINNYRATLMSLSQAHAKSNEEGMLGTFVTLPPPFTSANPQRYKPRLTLKITSFICYYSVKSV